MASLLISAVAGAALVGAAALLVMMPNATFADDAPQPVGADRHMIPLVLHQARLSDLSEVRPMVRPGSLLDVPPVCVCRLPSLDPVEMN